MKENNQLLDLLNATLGLFQTRMEREGKEDKMGYPAISALSRWP